MIKRNPKLDQPSLLSNGAAIGLCVNYFLGFLVVYPILGVLFTSMFSNYDGLLSPFWGYMILLVTTAITLLLGWPLFIEERDIKISKKVLTKKIFMNYAFMYLAMLVANPLIAQFTDTDQSQNQSAIADAIRSDALFVIISAVVMAPIVEEIVFRGVLYRKLRKHNRYLFAILMSVITFGFMHIFQSVFEGNVLDYPYIIIYIILGLFFVRIYEETGKLSGAIWLHVLNNVIGIAAILITLHVL
jgi:membrane protease YdiL (CAAX protease family)